MKRGILFGILMLTACVILWSDTASAQTGESTDINQRAISRDYWPTDSWLTAQPSDKGMDAAQLDIAEQCYSKMFPSAYSLIVIRHGYIVLEKYYNGMDADSTPHVYSITKSFTSALTGIAIDEGLIKGADEKLPDLFPEYMTPDIATEKKEITVKHMLTHTSGLRRDRGSSGDDMLKNIIQGELSFKPGSDFSYSNDVPSLLSGIITKRSGMSTRDYAELKLFKPLGITIDDWKTLPNSIYDGANNLFLSARDMARLGYLYLNNGYWDGNQILPADWVEESQQPHATFDRLKRYGYLMWVRNRPDTVQDREIRGYFPYGHMGQYIGIFPDLDLLVITTADASDPTRDTFFVMDYLHDYVRNFIFPAIKDLE